MKANKVNAFASFLLLHLREATITNENNFTSRKVEVRERERMRKKVGSIRFAFKLSGLKTYSAHSHEAFAR